MDLHTDLLILGAVAITGWKLIGWSGALCFGLRWVIQVVHRRRTAESRLPTSFWWMSVVGAALTLAYFVFGNPDSVGVIQSLLPLGLAVWNLARDHRDAGGGPARPAAGTPASPA